MALDPRPTKAQFKAMSPISRQQFLTASQPVKDENGDVTDNVESVPAEVLAAFKARRAKRLKLDPAKAKAKHANRKAAKPQGVRAAKR